MEGLRPASLPIRDCRRRVHAGPVQLQVSDRANFLNFRNEVTEQVLDTVLQRCR